MVTINGNQVPLDDKDALKLDIYEKSKKISESILLASLPNQDPVQFIGKEFNQSQQLSDESKARKFFDISILDDKATFLLNDNRIL